MIFDLDQVKFTTIINKNDALVKAVFHALLAIISHVAKPFRLKRIIIKFG